MGVRDTERSLLTWRIALLGITFGLVSIGTVIAAPIYPGGVITFIAFSIFCLISLLVPLFFMTSYFLAILSVFLFLGIWCKLVVHLLGDIPLIEPTGGFDYSPQSWNAALLVCTVGLAGFLAVSGLAALRRQGRPEQSNVGPWFQQWGFTLFAFSGVATLVLFAVNFHFAIIKIGFVPRVAVHPYIYLFIAFSVAWGAILWLLCLVFWLVTIDRLRPTSLLYVSGFEGALVAISMGSRVQMILHVVPAILTILYGMHAFGWRLRIAQWAYCSATLAVLFALSLAAVSFDRVYSFAEAVVAPPSSEILPEPPAQDTSLSVPPLTQAPAASLQAPGTQAPATPLQVPRTQASQASIQPSQRAASEPLEAPAISQVGIEHRIKLIPRELSRLLVMRWVGLEGVLTTTAAEEQLGIHLLKEGLAEDPAAGVDALYQRMAGATYQRFSNFVFMTIPGPIGVANYSGNLLVVFFSTFLLGLGFTLAEWLAGAALQNRAGVAVVATSFAYLVAQFMFARTLFFFTIEIAVAVVVIALFRLLLVRSRAASDSL